MEVLPGLHRFPIPIPNNPLGAINAYLVQTEAGSLLVDTGWNTAAAFQSLADQLAAAGTSFADLRYIFITHSHPDHYGLAGRLVEHTRAELVIHELEMALLNSRYGQVGPLLEEMNQWMRINGVTDLDRPSMQRASLEMLGMVAPALPNRVVRGGEQLSLGGLEFEIIWTPGHSPGHICLYERNRQLLFAGDHVLPKISPSVGMHVQSVTNPLVDYQNALQQIAQLPARLVLPAHHEPFEDLPGRVDEILQHHEQRLAEILAVVNGEPCTAYDIASQISWSTNGVPWQQLQPFVRRMAVTETLAHTELLAARGQLGKRLQDGLVYYVRP